MIWAVVGTILLTDLTYIHPCIYFVAANPIRFILILTFLVSTTMTMLSHYDLTIAQML